MTCRRVVITGIGVVSPHGHNPSPVFDALLAGQSAVRSIDIVSEAGVLPFIGAQTSGEPWCGLANPPSATSDRVGLYALAAVDSAIRDSDLDLKRENLSRIGVAVGTSLGGIMSEEFAFCEILRKNKARLSPFTLIRVMQNGPAAQIALRYQLAGPTLTHSITCSSSSVSIGESMRAIRHGYADLMLAGGAEALFTYVSVKAWQALNVLAPPREENIAETCRPFSRDRNGTVLGDGAAFVVLEEFERAVRRKARIYAELSGYGICTDSSHMTQPSVEGQMRAMELALNDGHLSADAIDYINAHGTGTQLNDLTETQAIRRLFGHHADNLAVSSTKSMHGHLVGAAGAIELIICALAIVHQTAPPTAHLHDPDPQCDLDYVPNQGRSMKIRAAMNNSFAVGGTASVLIVQQAS